MPDVEGRIRQRATRAAELAAVSVPVASLLTFYARLAEEQLRLLGSHAPRRVPPQGRHTLGDVVDRDAVVAALCDLLEWLPAAAPDALAVAAPTLASRSPAEWRRRLEAFIAALPGAVDEGCEGFVLDAALQPFAEACAAGSQDAANRDTAAAAAQCPFCGDHPSVAVLRDAGHGARRSHVCGVCLTEWAAPRLGCVACGESVFDRLPVFRADELAAARIDACETCRVYLKTIDLTRDGHAVPVVDDLATVPLDLWAREQGYRRLRPHLLRV